MSAFWILLTIFIIGVIMVIFGLTYGFKNEKIWAIFVMYLGGFITNITFWGLVVVGVIKIFQSMQ